MEVEFIFVQTKTASSFSGGKIGTFISGVRQFFGRQEPLGANDEIKELHAVKEHIFRLAHHMEANPVCRLFFATTGEWTSDPAVVQRARQGVLDLEKQEGGLFSKIEFTPLDATAIKQLYRELTQKVSRQIEFERHAILPLIGKVSEAYIGIVRCLDYIGLLEDDDGRLNKRLFYDNVRDFQGNNTVNSEIEATVKDGSQNDRFALLNNGITIVARNVSKTGTSFTLKDYQIVNGCQTSHIPFNNKANLAVNTYLPLKLIVTEDAEVTSQITKSNNSQTEVKPEAFEALEPFHKQLEELYLALGQKLPQTIYYERRSKQYDHLAIGRDRIISMPTQIKCFVAMFLDEPHSTHRYYGELLESYRPRLFQEAHRLLPYFVSGVALAAIEWGFRRGHLDRGRKAMKYQLLMLLRILNGSGDLPSVASKRVDGYCQDLLTILSDQTKCMEALKKADSLMHEVLSTFEQLREPPERTRSFTNALIDAALVAKKTQKQVPSGTTGTVKWFSDIKGYGFILGDDGQEIFVHQTSLLAGRWASLTAGERVRYLVG